MPRIAEITEKFFTRDRGELTLSEFTTQLIAEETKNGEIGVKKTSSIDYIINGQDVYRFLSDRGNGRIYDGLKSLELMSRLIRGAGESSTSLFDNVQIIAFSVDEMKYSTIEGASHIVNANLGLSEIHRFAKAVGSREIEQYDAFIAKIARQIRAGGFKAEEHLTEALVRVKALIKTVLNSKGT